MLNISTTLFLCDYLPEQEHFIFVAPVFFNVVGHCRASLILVPEFHDVETQPVHIEVYVAFFEIRCHGFPHTDFGVNDFNCLSSSLAKPLTVSIRLDKQYFQFAFCVLPVNLKNHAANDLFIMHYSVSLGLIVI